MDARSSRRSDHSAGCKAGSVPGRPGREVRCDRRRLHRDGAPDAHGGDGSCTGLGPFDRATTLTVLPGASSFRVSINAVMGRPCVTEVSAITRVRRRVATAATAEEDCPRGLRAAPRVSRCKGRRSRCRSLLRDPLGQLRPVPPSLSRTNTGETDLSHGHEAQYRKIDWVALVQTLPACSLLLRSNRGSVASASMSVVRSDPTAQSDNAAMSPPGN